MNMPALQQPVFHEQCHGREEPLSRVLETFDKASSGSAAFLFVGGEPGIGKSAFLTAAARRLRDRGALVLHARCRPGAPSLQPLVDVVREILEHLCQNGQPCARAEALHELLSGRAEGTEDRGGDDARSMGADVRLSVFDEMAELLVSLAEARPVALVFEDLEVADPGTRQLVLYLARVLASAPLLAGTAFRGLVLASAPSAEAVFGEGWTDGVNLVNVTLGGLSSAGVRSYLSSDRVVQRVLETTGGMPQMLEALVTCARPDALSPLRDLASSERELLEVLAVFGRPVGVETLQLLSALPHGQIVRGIARLLDRGLVEKVVVQGELRVAFARSGDQQAVYGEMSAKRKRVLHDDVGAYLRGTGRAEELEAAAHHLLLGSGGRAAVSVALAAAQRLEIAFCPERAADLYERALAHTPGEVERKEILERLCNVCEVTGRLDEALKHAGEIASLAPQDGSGVLRIARLHLRRGDFAAAGAALRKLELTEDTDAAFRVRFFACVAEATYLAGEIDRAAEAAGAGIALFASLGAAELLDRRALINLQNTMGLIHLDRGDCASARVLFVSNLEKAEDSGLAAEQVRAMVQLGLTSMRQADYAEAERYYQRARRRAERLGEYRYLGACLQHLGVLAERKRDYARALEYYQEAVNVWKKVGHRSFLAWVGLDLGKLYLDLGDVARAAAMVALADKLADTEPPLVTRINAELLRGRLAQQQCRFGEAADRYERARALAAAAKQTDRELGAVLHQGELLFERGEEAEAWALLARRGLPARGPVRLRALILRAALHDKRGDLGAARMDLGEALELAEGLADVEAGWQAQLQLGLLARRQGRSAEASRLLAEAARTEEATRRGLPEELQRTMAEQPRRAALRLALDNAAGGALRTVAPTATEELAEESRGRRGGQLWRRRYAEIIGEHPRMRQILEQVDKVGPTDAIVLIRGESGTGKELVADAIHRRSPRAKRPIVKVNCGALVENLLLSELFGHERGAFTGATQRRVGRFELADGGTIFLDEIGDISPKTQVALLRVLQDRSFERVGGTSRIAVDVRIICATNRNLEEMVANGQFREDLYYRLKGVQLDLPPLRERSEDVPLLADHFLQVIAQERGCAAQNLGPEACRLLSRYLWPGNVRELENVLRSVSLFADGTVLAERHFADYPELQRSNARSAAVPTEPLDLGEGAYTELRAKQISLRDLKKQVESECIQRALADAEGNITRAAELLGMKRPRLSQLVKEHGLQGRCSSN